MNKTIKWILIGFCTVVVLVIAALLIAPMFIDIQKYKPLIEEQATKAAGRSFKINGPLKLSLFPSAEIDLTDLHLGGFAGQDMLVVERFEVKASLLPLLSKEVQIEKFTVIGPKVVLERDEKGNANWEGLGSKKETEKVEPEESEEKSEGLPIKKLEVREFAFRNGTVIYTDKTQGLKKEIKDLDFELTDLSFDREIGLNLSGKLDGQAFSLNGAFGPVGENPGQGRLPLDLTVKLFDLLTARLNGSVTDPAVNPSFDLALNVEKFSPRDLVKAMGMAFPVNTTDSNALTGVALAMKTSGNLGEVALKDGVLEVDESKLAFSGQVKNFLQPDVKFAATLDKMDLDRYMPVESKNAEKASSGKSSQKGDGKGGTDILKKTSLDFSFKAGELKVKGFAVKNIEVAVKGKNGVFEIKPVQAGLGTAALMIQGKLDASRNPSSPSYDLGIQTNSFSPRELFSTLKMTFPVTASDPKTFTKASFGARVSGGLKSLTVSDGVVKLDDSKVDFSVKVNDLSSQDVSFNAALDRINLDRYLPPSGKKEEKKEDKASSSGKTDYSALRKLAVDGKFKAGAITVKNIAVTGLNLGVSARNGKLKLDPLSMSVFDGKINGRGAVDVSGEKPKTDLSVKAAGVQIKSALKQFLDLEMLEGATDGGLDLKMTGDQAKEILQGMDGEGSIKVSKGVLVGVDLDGLIQNRKSAFDMIASQGVGASTKFSDLKAGFKISDGVVDAPNISLSSSSLKVKAGGKIDLGRRTMNLRVEPEFSSGSVMVPLNIKGPWASPTIEPDLAGLIQNNLEKAISDPEQLKSIITGQESEEKTTTPDVKKGVENLLKGLSLPSQ